MGKAWEKIDLEGGGLQAVNQQLVRRLKRRTTAYALWLGFPVGAHRLYLDSRPGSLAYTALTALAVIAWIAPVDPLWVWLPLAGEAGFAVFDLFWIERRIVALNKQIRMAAYLGGGAAPPPEYRGRYTEEAAANPELDEYVHAKEQERGGHQPVNEVKEPSRKKAPSFAEQEAMLRELAKRKRDRHGD